MKILFLDIDGVLNRQTPDIVSSGNEETERQDEKIEEEKLRLLSRLVHKTGAALILHSGWRFRFDKDGSPVHPAAKRLCDRMKEYGLAFSGFTPDLSDEAIRKTRRFSLVKAKEILLWLQEQRTDVESWAVLDDLDLNDGRVHSHQVKTDGRIGLTEEDVKRAERILRRTEEKWVGRFVSDRKEEKQAGADP